jgi:hypothetical protein
MEEITNIYRALSRAQSNYKPVTKTGYNPHFKSSFLTYEDLIEASRESLVKEQISVTHCLTYDAERDISCLETSLLCNGQTIVSTAPIYLKDRTNIQSLGSAITYLKRYQYAAICGIAASEEDDDGNALSTASTHESASDKQIEFIKNLLRATPERESKICAHYAIKSIDNLTRNDASEVIKALQSKAKD